MNMNVLQKNTYTLNSNKHNWQVCEDDGVVVETKCRLRCCILNIYNNNGGFTEWMVRVMRMYMDMGSVICPVREN